MTAIAHRSHNAPTRRLFECRLEYIGRYDRVKVECARGRTALLPLDAFHGVASNTLVKDLAPRLKCDSCGQKGHVDVSVVWAGYLARRMISISSFVELICNKRD